MRQKQFEAEHQALWQEINLIVENKPGNRASQLPQLYRRLCQSLALAMQRGYSPALCDELQKLVHACHQRIYGTMVARPLTLQRWLLVEFPRRVREQWQLLLLAHLAFWGVAAGIGLLVWFFPHWAYSFVGPADLAHAREMYLPASFNSGRPVGGDVQMFGHYIWNNVSIGFRTFAGGIFGGLPSLISLGFNGIQLGVVGAWLSHDPATRINFWSFVITHASLEITGLVIASQAGIYLGMALIKPGRLSRRHALQAAGVYIFPVISGAAIMIGLAAFIEGFWSASTSISYQLKFAVGSIAWLLVIGFFIFAGRGQR